ncbi:MAG: HU family DNA-binding protein [Magnetococcales bacterium]|nr:HU family DNA-binding protein [Magnetococcales bacterium]
MKKQELIAQVARECSISQSKAALVVHGLTETIKWSLAAGEDVVLDGFGVFFVQEYPERLGHNPRTGELLVIPTRRVVCFRAGQNLKRSIAQA